MSFRRGVSRISTVAPSASRAAYTFFQKRRRRGARALSETRWYGREQAQPRHGTRFKGLVRRGEKPAQEVHEASSTVLVMGPSVSSVVDKRHAAVGGNPRPSVVLRPTRPLKEAGIRTEPPVSEPTAAAANPRRHRHRRARRRAAGNARSGSSAFPGVPKCGLRPRARKGELGHVRFAQKHRARRVQDGRRRDNRPRRGARPRAPLNPAALTSPWVSIRSLSASGTPWSGPKSTPARKRASARRAWALQSPLGREEAVDGAGL